MNFHGIEIEILKKNIKNMHLYVLPPDGRIKLTVPFFVSKSRIETFVEDNLIWITTKRAQIIENEKNKPQPLEYVNGDTIKLWGEKYILELNSGKKTVVTIDGGKVILTVKASASTEQKEKAIKEWHRVQLKNAVRIYIDKWEDLTGFRCSSWQIKDMKTRWGTCNTGTKKIWIALRLAELEPKCLEYVILHELAHTVVPNHGAEFKAIMTRYMPDWVQIQKSMKNLSKN